MSLSFRSESLANEGLANRNLICEVLKAPKETQVTMSKHNLCEQYYICLKNSKQVNFQTFFFFRLNNHCKVQEF